MKQKKTIREAFRKDVFERDGYRCAMCGRNDCKLDAHHIQDRHNFPNGGYVKENGITLCDDLYGCHWKAEHFHAHGVSYPGYSPDELFARINSNLELAKIADEAN